MLHHVLHITSHAVCYIMNLFVIIQENLLMCDKEVVEV